MKPILYEGVLWGMPVVFKAYQTFNLLALAVACVYGVWALRKHQVQWTKIVSLAALMILAFLVGARLYYALLHGSAMVAEPSKLWQLSLINFGLYGGLAGSLLVLGGWCRREGVALWPLMDQGIPWLALSLGLSKLGCLMNGCCYGIVTEGPFGVYFPRAQGALGGWLGPGLIGTIFGGSLQLRHPEQLYEVLVFILSAVLVIGVRAWARAHGHGKLRLVANIPGFAALAYLGLITLGRLALYPLRDYPESSSLTEMLRGPITYGLVFVALGIMAASLWRAHAEKHVDSGI